MFTLKFDHFEELFDWLSLEDLVMLGQTCKRMQIYVGHFIRTNYAAANFEYTSNGIGRQFVSIKLDGLSSYLRKLVFCNLEYNSYDYSTQNWSTIPRIEADHFKSLTEVLLTNVFTDAAISHIKDILGQLKTVKLKFPHFADETQTFYEIFLQYCRNINRLCILDGTPNFWTDKSWLLRNYPTLKHLELTLNDAKPIDELRRFFEQNTNIETFATNAETMLKNSNIFKTIKLNWDVLSVQFHSIYSLSYSRHLLNELFERGLFENLHVYWRTLYTTTFDQGTVNQLASFKGLTKLYIDGMLRGTDLSSLINLSQLCIYRASSITNMEILARKLFNLDSIQFTYAEPNDILPFIRHSPKLTTIVVFWLEENDKQTLNITELNRERSKLAKAKKVTIYVEEKFYQKVKWNQNQTICSCIEIKRGSSYDISNHNFDYMNDAFMTF